jgi:hypothetical protein
MKSTKLKTLVIENIIDTIRRYKLEKAILRKLNEQGPFPITKQGPGGTDIGGDAFGGLQQTQNRQSAQAYKDFQWSTMDPQKKAEAIAKGIQDAIESGSESGALAFARKIENESVYDSVYRAIQQIPGNKLRGGSIATYIKNNVKGGSSYDSKSQAAPQTTRHPGYHISNALGLDLTRGEWQDDIDKALEKFKNRKPDTRN